MRNQRLSAIVWNLLGILGFVFAFAYVIEAKAQLNPSSAVLVRPSGRTPDPKTLSSDRYTIKPSGSLRNSRPPTSVSGDGVAEPAPAGASGAANAPGQTMGAGSVNATTGTLTAAPATGMANSAPPTKAAGPPDVAPGSKPPLGASNLDEEEGVAVGAGASRASENSSDSKSNGVLSTDKISEVMLGGTDNEIRSYQTMLHPEDRRRNIIEIVFAPAFIANTSQANYSYRQYTSTGPAFVVGADVWLTPFFGLHTALMSSLRSDIQSVYGGQNRVRVDHQLFDVGLQWRKFFGVVRSSPSMTLGVGYSEYQLKVPMDAVQRQALRTSGFQLEVEAKFPSTPKLTWNFGASLAPKVIQQEIDTGSSWRSGVDAETGIVGVWLGAEHIFDRRHVVFWQLKHRVEKTIYSGSATTADPATGAVPSGVAVDNSFFIFSLGLRWGN